MGQMLYKCFVFAGIAYHVELMAFMQPHYSIMSAGHLKAHARPDEVHIDVLVYCNNVNICWELKKVICETFIIKLYMISNKSYFSSHSVINRWLH